jgi:alpha-tubulin suppressor-like RCC1 family protein
MAAEITSIPKTECIGNSLITINNNFANLKNAIDDIDTGIAIQDEGTQIGANIGSLNFVGDGVNATTQNGVATVLIPGFEPRKVVKLEERSPNSGSGQNNYFILNDGSLRVVGYNAYGELGLGYYDSRVFVPKIPAFDPPLEVDENIKLLRTQGVCVYIVTTKGRLYGAGYNAQGQIGQGNTKTYQVVYKFINVLGETLTPIDPVTNPVFGYAAAKNDPVVDIGTGTGYVSTYITLWAITQSGALYAWGYNYYGQTGIPYNQTGWLITSPQRVTNLGIKARKLAVGGGYTTSTVFVVDEDDKLYVCGRNADGQAGINDNTGANANITSFRLVRGLPPGYRVNNITVGGTWDNITTFVTLKDGSVWSAGVNTDGIVTGTGTASPYTVVQFSRLPFFDSEFVEDVRCQLDYYAGTIWALIREGTAYRTKGWGNNYYGQLGIGNYSYSSRVIQDAAWPWLQQGAQVKDIAVAGAGVVKTTLVLDTNNNLWATGYNGTGLCGTGTSWEVPYYNRFQRVLFNPALGYPVEIRATNNDYGRGYVANFLALLNTGRVLAWGYDSTNVGQTGTDIYPEIVSVPQIVQIAQ